MLGLALRAADASDQPRRRLECHSNSCAFVPTPCRLSELAPPPLQAEPADQTDRPARVRDQLTA